MAEARAVGSTIAAESGFASAPLRSREMVVVLEVRWRRPRELIVFACSRDVKLVPGAFQATYTIAAAPHRSATAGAREVST